LEAVHLAIELRRRRVRHVHVHFANNAAAVALLAARFDRGLSYSLTVHGSRDFLDAELNRLEEKIAFACFVRCISNFCLGQVMIWSNPNQWDRFFVAHCGIDTDSFLPRARRSESTSSIDLVAIGRLDPIKGFHVLFRACKRLEEEKVSWSLKLIGDGPLMPELVEHARYLKIDHKVTFVGAADQRRVREYLDSADALVLSSFLEGLPVVLMEAMAMALPVIATRVGGVAELVEHEQSGLLVDAGSVDSLAAALLRLAREPTLRFQLGEAGRKKVLAEFSVQQSGKELAGKFSQICAETPRLKTAPYVFEPILESRK
jgi:colanic acid/amylovoran biosynthesis glycosyltransferase